MESNYDIIIIGGGCAGLTAAIYARRASKTVLLLENQVFGGQITYSPNVENYPGYMSISGIEFSDKLIEQAKALNTDIKIASVLSVKDGGNLKTVVTDSGEITCKAVIIATGLKHRKTGIENEEKLVGRGISYCAVCDGAFFKGKDVAVYGGGNTAIQDAVFLSDLCNSVTVIHRRESFRADAHIIQKLKEKNNVKYLLNSTIKSIDGKNMLSSVTTVNKISSDETELQVSGLFIAIGQIPQNEIFRNAVTLDEYGFISAGEDCKTSTAGIFAAGDCRTKDIRQLATASGDGAVAATNACRFIDAL